MRRSQVGAAVALAFLVAACGRGDGDQTAASTTSSSSTTVTSSTTTTIGDGATTTAATSAPGPTSDGSVPTGTAPPPVRPDDSLEGFRVTYPEGWAPAGRLLGTAFSNGATCGAAAIVDRSIPDESGPAPAVEQSLVQVCWRPLDSRSLDQFMADTYGGGLGGFEATTLAGRPAFATRAATTSTWFVDTGSRRYQVATAVTASPALEARRLAEVQQVLDSLSLPD